MSTPEGAGSARPGRLAGLVLLAVAGIALVIGLISVINGGSTDQGASPPPSSQPPATEQPSSTPAPPPPSPTSNTSTSSETPAPPPSTTPSSAAPPTQTPPPNTNTNTPGHTEPVRVYNNSLIKGLADRAASDFRGSGWTVPVVDNYSGGTIATTTVYFRPGTDEEAEGRALAKEFGLRPEPRFDGIKDAAPGIIVIVTREYNPKTK